MDRSTLEPQKQQLDLVINHNATKRQNTRCVLCTVSLVSLAVFSLMVAGVVVAVLYSPLVRGQDTDQASLQDLMDRIQQLEERNEQLGSQVEELVAGINLTMDALSSLPDIMDRVQQIEEGIESLESVQDTNNTTNSQLETMIEQLSATTTSQVASLNTSVQRLRSTVNNISSVQTNIQEDLDTLESVNLYQNCISETRECTVTTGASVGYWRICTTTTLTADPTDTQYYYTDMRCEYESTFGYFESTTLRRSSTVVQCRCDVTNPSGTGGHNLLLASFFATCRLIVTRCPRSVNLLN